MERDGYASIMFFNSIDKMWAQIKSRQDDQVEIIEFLKEKRVPGILKFSKAYLGIYKGIAMVYEFDGVTMTNTMFA